MSQTPSPEFRALYTGNQSRIYAYILSVLSNPDQASDVLQETNVVLWEKAEQFTLGTNFVAWALQIARFQILAYRQRHRRDRLVFSEKAMDLIAQMAMDQEVGEAEQKSALEHCLQQLAPRARQMLEMRYTGNLTLAEIAQRLDRSYSSTGVAMHRIRAGLAQCIELQKGVGHG